LIFTIGLDLFPDKVGKVYFRDLNIRKLGSDNFVLFSGDNYSSGEGGFLR